VTTEGRARTTESSSSHGQRLTTRRTLATNVAGELRDAAVAGFWHWPRLCGPCALSCGPCTLSCGKRSSTLSRPVSAFEAPVSAFEGPVSAFEAGAGEGAWAPEADQADRLCAPSLLGGVGGGGRCETASAVALPPVPLVASASVSVLLPSATCHARCDDSEGSSGGSICATVSWGCRLTLGAGS